MSNDEKTCEIAGAICAPPPPSENGKTAVPQPRQPSSLQGLLKFAMEATKSEDAPHESHFLPLDEDRKRFLQQALSSLTIDVVEELMKNIRILEKVHTLEENGDDSEYVGALDTISEFVCDINTANDFHKIGGFAVIQPCLTCKSPVVRAEACNLLAELSQNNPYCQKVVLENGFMPILMNIVETDSDDCVVVKALYAISCNVRQNVLGCNQFIQYKGVQVFLELLKRKVEKFNVKICFLLNSLCDSTPDFKSRLIFVGYLPVLFSLLSPTPNSSHEHILALLLKLIENNPVIINECRQDKYKEDLLNCAYAIRGREEYCTEEEYCRAICMILFPQNLPKVL